MRSSSSSDAPVVVIGAGLGGLSAALHLLGAGRQVLVLERAQHPGGWAGTMQTSGYQFDTGPSVLTMPEIIDATFGAVGESLQQNLPLQRLDPAYQAHFADGSTLNVHTDPEQMTHEIAQVCGPGAVPGYLRWVSWLRKLYDTEMPNFIDRDISSLRDVLTPAMLRLLLLGALQHLEARAARDLTDERLRRIFTFQALYAGLSPQRSLALYAVIGYMDAVNGVYAPLRGGMHALPEALAAAAGRHGAQLQYGRTVTRVEVTGERACAVHTQDGDRIAASALVINSGLPQAYSTLLPGRTPRRVAKVRHAPSCAVLHIGRRGQPAPGGAHHTIGFGEAWQSTFTELIDEGVPMRDPSFLLCTPTISDDSLAPPGCQTHFVLFPTPNLTHHYDWDHNRERFTDHMLATLDDRGFGVLTEGIQAQHLVTPRDWERAGATAGTPFSAAHTFAQTGPFRSAMRHATFKNVVFCGADTHPGVGVPMVLISGRLAAAAITQERGSR